ncbi:unnamed protein product, partial [Nesidiocoris tenuis]
CLKRPQFELTTVHTSGSPKDRRRFATLVLNCIAARARTRNAQDRLALTVDYGLSGSVFFSEPAASPYGPGADYLNPNKV